MFEGVSTNATASIKLSDGYSTTAVATFGTHTGKAFMTVGGGEVFHVSASSAGYRSFFSGSVGIGKPSPSYTLDVKGEGRFGVNDGILLTDTGGTSFVKAVNNHLNLFTSRDQDDIFFTTGTTPTTKMFIQGNTGRVGIGTTGPGEKLHIEGTTGATRAKVKTTTGNAIFRVESSVSDFSLLGRGDSNAFNIYNANQAKTPFKIIGGSDENDTLVITTGKVGIGTDNPLSPLHVKGNTRLEPDSGNNNFLTFTSQTSTQANQHYYVNNNSTWNIFSGPENYHIKRALGNPGTSPGVSKTYVTFHGGDATGGDHQGAEFHVPVTASFFKGDGSGLTNITSGQIALFGGDLSEHNLTTINTAGDGLDGEANLNFDGNQLQIGPESADAGVDVHINHNATSDAVLLLESHDFTNDSIVALRQQGTWPNNATGVDLVYDGGVDKFFIKGYNANTGGFVGNSVSIKSTTPTNTLVLDENGNVGIGVASPTETLAVSGAIELTTTGKIGFDVSDVIGSYTVKDFNNTTATATNLVAQYGLTRPQTAAFDPVILAGYYSLDFVTQGIQRMKIRHNGDVGIGTDTPAAKLDVRGDVVISDGTDPAITLFNNDSVANGPDILFHESGLIAAESKIHLNINSDGGSNDLIIRTGGDTDSATEVMRVTSDAKLGLGGVDPANKGIHVYKNNNDVISGNDANSQLLLENDGGSGDVGIKYLLTGTKRWATFIDHSNDDAFTIRDSTQSVNHITLKYVSSTSRIGIFNTSPSYPLDVSGEARFQGQLRMEEGNKIVWSANTDTGFIRFNSTSDAASDFEIGTTDNGTEHIIFTLSGTEKARINGAGIQVESTVTSADTQHTLITNSGGGYIEAKSNNSTYGLIVRDYNSSEWLNIDANSGYGSIGYNSSDGPLYITDDDRLGINYSTPAYKLHVVDDGDDTIAKFTSTHDNGYIRVRQNVDTTGAAGILTENSTGVQSFHGSYLGELRMIHSTGPGNTNGLRFKNSCLIVGAGGDPDQTGANTGNTVNFGLNLVGNAAMDSNLASDGGSVNAYRYYLNANGLEGQTEDGATLNGSAISWVIAQFSTPGVSNLSFAGFDDGAISNKAYIDFGESGELNFTGQHPCKPVKPISEYQDKIGYIVIATGTIANQPREHVKTDGTRKNLYPDFPLDAPTVDEALPVVKLSEQPNDKRVYGVISQPDDPNTTRRDRKSFAGGFNVLDENRADDRLIINALGEGAIMVCNINGNLENGDYITTSHIEGLGMKQDDDLLHNYTAAKIIEDCNFASGTTDVTHNGVTYKAKLVGCTYHCG